MAYHCPEPLSIIKDGERFREAVVGGFFRRRFHSLPFPSAFIVVLVTVRIHIYFLNGKGSWSRPRRERQGTKKGLWNLPPFYLVIFGMEGRKRERSQAVSEWVNEWRMLMLLLARNITSYHITYISFNASFKSMTQSPSRLPQCQCQCQSQPQSQSSFETHILFAFLFLFILCVRSFIPS